MIRTEIQNPSHPYLDFTLSMKHPLLADWTPLTHQQENAAAFLQGLMPDHREYLLQLYLAFTGRLSQYIGTRESSPVIARRLNPSLFYRAWSSDEEWFDLGIGHESNGQHVNTQAGFERTEQDHVLRGEPPDFARDVLSRGWDYTYLEWQHVWTSQWYSHLQIRHFLDRGPFQGKSEEYNTWEDDGTVARPRRQYDGVSLGLQYNFNRSRCFLGTAGVCFKQLDLTQETGYSGLFKHNTTTVEFTTDFFGLPIQLWSRTGYGVDLVDYYRYTKSWGLGFALKTP